MNDEARPTHPVERWNAMQGRHTLARRALALAIALSPMACDSVAGPEPLDQFSWGELPQGQAVEDGIDVSVGLGDVFVLGELTTPTRCYALDADFSQSGDRLTLDVRATSTQTGACADNPGAYRYTAVLRGLAQRDYELHVVHAVTGGARREFTESVSLR
jgi:hypothetical protein